MCSQRVFVERAVESYCTPHDLKDIPEQLASLMVLVGELRIKPTMETASNTQQGRQEWTMQKIYEMAGAFPINHPADIKATSALA